MEHSGGLWSNYFRGCLESFATWTMCSPVLPLQRKMRKEDPLFLEDFSQMVSSCDWKSTILGFSQVSYLGNLIDEHWLHPTTEKVQSISKAAQPTDKTQLWAYFAFLNFYRRCLPTASTISAHVIYYSLLKLPDIRETNKRMPSKLQSKLS